MARVVIGSPATVISPPSRSSKPAIIEIVVVLPAPFGPRSPYRLAGIDVEPNPVDGDQRAEAPPQIMTPEHPFARHLASQVCPGYAVGTHPLGIAVGGRRSGTGHSLEETVQEA